MGGPENCGREDFLKLTAVQLREDSIPRGIEFHLSKAQVGDQHVSLQIWVSNNSERFSEMLDSIVEKGINGLDSHISL